jgi:hypothetical protein
MLRTALAMFMIAGMTAWGQAPETANGGDTVDRAAAYYHYTLAHMYAEMAAASGGRNAEYLNKAIENYKAAIKADPQLPILSKDLSEIYPRRLAPLSPPSVPRAAPR